MRCVRILATTLLVVLLDGGIAVEAAVIERQVTFVGSSGIEAGIASLANDFALSQVVAPRGRRVRDR